MEDAEALLAETQNLPVLHTSPLAVDAETLYRDLTGGCDMLDLERSVYETPSPSTVVCFSRGEAPLYDSSFLLKPWTAQQTHAPRSIIPLLPIHHLNAIFDPTENEDSLSETALSFAAPEAAAKQLDMSAYGVSLTDMRCRSLTAQALQTLWDERSAAGTLRENRWGDGSSPIKNHSTVAA